MKLSSIHFLAKSNIKGNKNKTAITVLLCMLVIAITVVSCFSVTMTQIMNDYKKDYRARNMYLAPFYKLITEDAIAAIEELDHVERVVDAASVIRYHGFDILSTSDPELSAAMENNETWVSVNGLYEGEEKRVIKGKTLDKAPAFSCLVPSIFAPISDPDNIYDIDVDYIDGRTLIGETLTIKGGNGHIFLTYFNYPGEGNYVTSNNVTPPSPEYTLTVVGTYPCTYATFGSPTTLIVSEETNRLMSEMVFEEAGIDLETDKGSVALWWNTPSIHEYRIILDSPDNIPEVYNIVRHKMEYDTSMDPNDLIMDKTTKLMHTLFTKVGSFITIAVLFVSAILLVQSSVNSIRQRKGIIGLMKAIGYKNHQIFLTLIYEQLFMTLRATLIGGVISALIVMILNYRFSHGTFRQLMYVIDWKIFFPLLGVAFLIALIIPLTTQLLLLRKLVKIQPREAMSTR